MNGTPCSVDIGMTDGSTLTDHDLIFYWDPVCPFAWLTSRWVEMVAERRDYSVDWRFISLRILNKDKDYARSSRPNTKQGTPQDCVCSRRGQRQGR